MSTYKNDKRGANRIALSAPLVAESIGQAPLELHANLQKIYTRVDAVPASEKFPGTLRDLSTNGAFVASENPLPLLARVAFRFELPTFGALEGVGWTLWRRASDCEVPGKDGSPVVLPAGFGLLFEAIPLDARIAIQQLVKKTAQSD